MRSKVWATVASLAALASVLGPAFLYDHTIYDAALAILTITAIAVIWYTAFSYELVSAMWTDRDERAADRKEKKVERRARLRIVVISAKCADLDAGPECPSPPKPSFGSIDGLETALDRGAEDAVIYVTGGEGSSPGQVVGFGNGFSPPASGALPGAR